jgi:hypothetical protein
MDILDFVILGLRFAIQLSEKLLGYVYLCGEYVIGLLV